MLIVPSSVVGAESILIGACRDSGSADACGAEVGCGTLADSLELVARVAKCCVGASLE